MKILLSAFLIVSLVAPASTLEDQRDIIAASRAMKTFLPAKFNSSNLPAQASGSTLTTLLTPEQVRLFLPGLVKAVNQTTSILLLDKDIAKMMGVTGGRKCKVLSADVAILDPNTRTPLSKETLLFVLVLGTPHLLIGGHTNMKESFGAPAHYLYRSDRAGNYFAGFYQHAERGDKMAAELFNLPGAPKKKPWSTVSPNVGREHLLGTISNWVFAIQNMPEDPSEQD